MDIIIPKAEAASFPSLARFAHGDRLINDEFFHEMTSVGIEQFEEIKMVRGAIHIKDIVSVGLKYKELLSAAKGAYMGCEKFTHIPPPVLAVLQTFERIMEAEGGGQ